MDMHQGQLETERRQILAAEDDGPPHVNNPRHKAFADEYLKIGSATQAAINNGYSERTANSQGPQLLRKPEVAAYVAWHRAQSSQEAQFSHQRWKEELGRVAFSNVQDFTRVDGDGNLVPDFSNATREQLAAISSVKFKKRDIRGPRGEVIATEVDSEFKLWDKLRATEQLGRHAGLLKTDETRVVVDVADRLLNARRRILTERMDGSGGSVIDAEAQESSGSGLLGQENAQGGGGG